MGSGLQVWSQTAATNATADSAVNWAEGMAPSAVNDSARAQMASVAKWRDDNNGTLVTTGSSSAFTGTSNQTSTGLVDGYTVSLKFHTTADASATYNHDALGAKQIQFVAGSNLGFGQIIRNTIRKLTYSSTGSGQWIVNSPLGDQIGDVKPYAGSTAPSLWLACNGAAYSRTTYADLFALIGTTYGSSDSSTFKVPDTTGRVIAGKEASATRLTTAGSGINGATLGAVGGEETHTLSLAEAPTGQITYSDSHYHFIANTDSGNNAGTLNLTSSNYLTGQNATSADAWNYLLDGSATSATIGKTSAPQSGASITDHAGGGAHNNTQPTIVLNYIIFAGV